MSEIFNPIKSRFNEPLIKNMCEYNELVEQFNTNYEDTWAKFAKEKLDWFKPFDNILDESNAPFYKWFSGGELNVAYNCVDRHLKTKKNKAAIIFEGDNGDQEIITYRELAYRISKTANMFKNRFKVKKGDRVVIYMPMIPEAAIVMLACAKIGAIHSVVFGGFSAEALRDRIIDAGAVLVVTADGAYRKGKPYMLKPVVDTALEDGCECVKNVCVVERNGEDIKWVQSRDYSYNELIKYESSFCKSEPMESEDPLFLLYTSGSTGKPKGVQHSTALEDGCECVKNVCVVERNKEDIKWVQGRDYSYNELIKYESSFCKSEPMESEDPLFLLYTSGSTGKPKGVQHSTAGYILWAQMTMEWVFDLKDNDTYWCTADVGWITGHTYIVYGPLAAGATTIMFEGVPTFPDAGRCWKMVEEYRINQFYTAPTAIRLLHKMGADEPSKYDLSSLRILGTVGEPIDPPAWKWYYEEVGGSQCSIVDTYWQTETGGHIISPLPAATPIKPACATFPLPGIIAEVIEEDGTPTAIGEKGFMCITKPWPSMIRTIWNDPDRFVKSYFGDCKKDGKVVYFTGDGAMQSEDGYITITGRTDDVINVSGHRMGTAEVEAAIKKHENVASVAVVGKPHEIKGEGIFAYIVLKHVPISQNDDLADEIEIVKEINALIKIEIGAIALCDDMAFVPDLPKTRSGKIMRRILRSIVKGEKITQDTSTLEDPSIVQTIENIINN